MWFPYTIKRYGLIALLIVLPGFARAGSSEKVTAYTSVFKCKGGILKTNYTDRHSILGTACQAVACQRESLRTKTGSDQGGVKLAGIKTKPAARLDVKK